ncbi:hypothetical protein [Paractinoplanes maris]|uniref:hypothetical protein n=1 Tax=Paractinoplanes maris TaxID=1734446 RepID=UPI0020210042|nr:hypothetical protein [Actinoplanes maris]
MRTTALVLLAVIALVLAPPAVASAAAPARVCTIRDERLDELSGLVAAGAGYVVVNDGSDFADRRRIFFLDGSCKVTRTVRYPSRPRDTEDLGRAADGTLWVADIGDNGGSRTTVALWKLAPGAKTPILHRLTYPDGAHDAEAVLVPADGNPIIVTKSGGTAGIYVAAGALRRGSTTTLRKAGDVTVPLTGTSNPFSFLGRAVVTGGATSPDGRHVVLRTYADAFEYDVTDGDVVGALTSGQPRAVALPDEPQGESVTYSADGRSLLTVSETSGDSAGARPVILRYPLPDRPAAAPTSAAPPSAAPTSAAPLAAPASSPAAAELQAESPGFNYIAVVAGAVAVAAVVLAALLVVRRSRP